MATEPPCRPAGCTVPTRWVRIPNSDPAVLVDMAPLQTNALRPGLMILNPASGHARVVTEEMILAGEPQKWLASWGMTLHRGHFANPACPVVRQVREAIQRGRLARGEQQEVFGFEDLDTVPPVRIQEAIHDAA